MHFSFDVVKRHPYVIGGLALAVFLFIVLRNRGASGSNDSSGASGPSDNVQIASANAAAAVQVAQLNANAAANQASAQSAAQAQTFAYNLQFEQLQIKGAMDAATISGINQSNQLSERSHEADLAAAVAGAQISSQQAVALSAQATEAAIAALTTKAQLDTAALAAHANEVATAQNAATARLQITAGTEQTRILSQTSIAQSALATHQNEAIAQLLAQEQMHISDNSTAATIANINGASSASRSQSMWGGIASIAGSLLGAFI